MRIGRKKVCSSVDTEKKKNNHKTKTEKRVKVQLGRIYVVQFAKQETKQSPQHFGYFSNEHYNATQEAWYNRG